MTRCERVIWSQEGSRPPGRELLSQCNLSFCKISFFLTQGLNCSVVRRPLPIWFSRLISHFRFKMVYNFSDTWRNRLSKSQKLKVKSSSGICQNLAQPTPLHGLAPLRTLGTLVRTCHHRAWESPSTIHNRNHCWSKITARQVKAEFQKQRRHTCFQKHLNFSYSPQRWNTQQPAMRVQRKHRNTRDL